MLDFEDIEKRLASKLTDDDIAAVLVCINAAGNLAGCKNVTGSGLEPLRGSAVLEKIDLSLVGRYEKPRVFENPRISEDAIVPILWSIADAEGSSLKHLHLRGTFRDSSTLTGFLERYEQLLAERGCVCAECERSVNVSTRGGFQDHTCFTCTKNFCYECEDNEGLDGDTLRRCWRCEKETCPECNGLTFRRCNSCGCEHCLGSMTSCNRCDCYTCHDCKYICDECEQAICKDCLGKNSCLHCGKMICPSCTRAEIKEKEDMEEEIAKLKQEIEELKASIARK